MRSLLFPGGRLGSNPQPSLLARRIAVQAGNLSPRGILSEASAKESRRDWLWRTLAIAAVAAAFTIALLGGGA